MIPVTIENDGTVKKAEEPLPVKHPKGQPSKEINRGGNKTKIQI